MSIPPVLLTFMSSRVPLIGAILALSPRPWNDASGRQTRGLIGHLLRWRRTVPEGKEHPCTRRLSASIVSATEPLNRKDGGPWMTRFRSC
jgi:hypothetical protein